MNSYPVPLLSSAARAANTFSADSDPIELPFPGPFQALLLVVDITATAGPMLLSPGFEVQDPSGLGWVRIWQSAVAIAALGNYAFGISLPRIGVALTTSAVFVELVTLPLLGAKWRFAMYHGNANLQTYSAGAYWLAI